MQCLLELLRRQRVDRAIDEAEWEAALTLAEGEHVLPVAAARMRSQQAAITPAITARLDQIERDAVMAAFYWNSELKGVLRALGQRDIRAVPLKGPFLAERLYGETALRVSRDLDLLVAGVDLRRAEAVLTAIGFVSGERDDYHRAWDRGTTRVELHYDVENPLAFDFDVESALLRVRPSVFQGEVCWQLAPEDELLFLCVHAARHRFERLSLIVDLQLAFEKLTPTAEGWQLRPEVAELNSLLTLGLAMACHLQPDFNAAADFSPSRNQREHLEKLADRLWNRLLVDSSEPLDWRAVHAFFLEIETPGWPRLRRRIRHTRILMGRVIAPDYAFAGQFGLHRTWQVRMLRPVRLLCEALRPHIKRATRGDA
jgi:hypothetical protein